MHEIYINNTINCNFFVLNLMSPRYLKVVHRPFIIIVLPPKTFKAEAAHNVHPWIAKSSYLTISHINHTDKMVINNSWTERGTSCMYCIILNDDCMCSCMHINILMVYGHFGDHAICCKIQIFALLSTFISVNQLQVYLVTA